MSYMRRCLLPLRCGVLYGLLLVASALAPLGIANAQAETAQPNLAAGDRFTVLLVGLDRRTPNESSRSDVIMLLSIERKSRSLSILSIPRDLWVPIPEYGWYRINAAYLFGEVYEGSGGALARRTVESVFDIPIHAVAAVDFDGFVALVDAFGGIDVTVAKDLVDNTYPTRDYGYKSIFIPEGAQHMDGETALVYSRTRHPDNDFKRMGRQQNVVQSARARLFADEMVLLFPFLFERFNEIIETDLTVAEQLTLLRDLYLLRDVEVDARVIEPPLVYDYVTDGGAFVLLPDWELVRPVIDELFGGEAGEPEFQLVQ
jgi:LCP family protein required for cell wall assembly